MCGSVTLAAGCLFTVKCSGGGRNPVSQAKYSLSPPVIGERERELGRKEEVGKNSTIRRREAIQNTDQKKYQESGITSDTSTKDV